jgi:Rps23 Pro-64 3,4-dihydroxylase Tpa1-like proline 4-hydroxylase
MLDSKQFDIEGYFTRGYTTTQVDLDVSDYLLECAKREHFREESKLSPTSPLLPPWDSLHRDTKLNEPPPYISEFWNRIATHSYYEFFHQIYGEFSQLNMMLQKYVRGTKLGWHQDVHEGVHITNILYLSEHEFTESDGGYLRLGKWNLDEKYWGINDSVLEIDRVMPRHGTLVSICNLIPTFCHNVAQVVSDHERYSLICRFGYAENTSKNKISALF